MPIRRCIICRQSFQKNILLRFANNSFNNNVEIVQLENIKNKVLFSRSFYICQKCFQAVDPTCKVIKNNKQIYFRKSSRL